jgi:hypothetical protein
MIELVDLSIQDDEYWTFTEAEGVGEYCQVPLSYSSIGVPNTIEYTLGIIRNKFGSMGQRLDIAYTYGHDGEDSHEWYVVGYQPYEHINKTSGVVTLKFAPKYPDMFPVETAMTESNLHDCSYPDIYNRILGDRGKLPPA